ncbi:hypothetical protein ACNHKD_03005 [Methylocystis sp. JAN1]|jgi:hypothetical protein|uniref:hypothetical protein n=1 Tax=Methylocystis sp. JAN1 TaxID=3397211 RepID=UPI003FA1C822
MARDVSRPLVAEVQSMSYDYSDAVARALRTEGGHLFIGRGGFSLNYANGYLSGYDCEAVKEQAIAAGLPVIDSRRAAFERVAILAIKGPMIAVGRAPDPAPWKALSYAPLLDVAKAYAAAGAEVHNLPLHRAAMEPRKKEEGGFGLRDGLARGKEGFSRPVVENRHGENR